jgi:hypothetical protein
MGGKGWTQFLRLTSVFKRTDKHTPPSTCLPYKVGKQDSPQYELRPCLGEVTTAELGKEDIVCGDRDLERTRICSETLWRKPVSQGTKQIGSLIFSKALKKILKLKFFLSWYKFLLHHYSFATGVLMSRFPSLYRFYSPTLFFFSKF